MKPAVANSHAKSLSRRVHYPKGAYPRNMGESAPVLTFEINMDVAESRLQNQLISLKDPNNPNNRIDQQISYYQADLPLDDQVTCIRVEFPSASPLPAIDFNERKSKKRCVII